MTEAAKIGDIFVTVTGNYHVIAEEHFKLMRDGAIVCQLRAFQRRARSQCDSPAPPRGSTTPREFVEQFELHDGRKVCVLADGRLVNLAAAEGHPAAVMDMSFADQALATSYSHEELCDARDAKCMTCQLEIDEEVAQLKLASLNIDIDTLTPEQEKYAASWSEGT